MRRRDLELGMGRDITRRDFLAYEYAYLGEPESTDDKPCVLGRKPFGRMAIANSDAGGEAYADRAIDQAHRAVQQLVALAD